MVYGGIWTDGGKEGEKKELRVGEEGREERGAGGGTGERKKKPTVEVVFHNPHHLVIVDLIRWLLLSLHLQCTQGA